MNKNNYKMLTKIFHSFLDKSNNFIMELWYNENTGLFSRLLKNRYTNM